MKPLARQLVERMAEFTANRNSELIWTNTRDNLRYREKSISDVDLAAQLAGGDSAIVIGAGPSLQRRDSISQIAESGYKGTIVCADGALPQCLRKGLVPSFVVTVDPNPTRIIRWFGDPDLAAARLAEDDYFRRQDLDQLMGERELERNRETMALVDKFGPRMNAIIATCISPRVTRRCLEAGMRLYWWNPLYDDTDSPESMTRRAYALNKVPCMATGGNCGTSAWVFATALLHKKRIGLVGMDFSYAPGTSLEKTQYYAELSGLFGDQASDAYIEVTNPHTKETWFTDPTYYWYRETFLEMARGAEVTTFNCTEGGILFGEGVEFVSLKGFLQDSRTSQVAGG